MLDAVWTVEINERDYYAGIDNDEGPGVGG